MQRKESNEKVEERKNHPYTHYVEHFNITDFNFFGVFAWPGLASARFEYNFSSIIKRWAS